MLTSTSLRIAVEERPVCGRARRLTTWSEPAGGLGSGMAADYRTLSSDLGNRGQARDGSFAPSEDEPAARFTEDDTAT